MHIRDILRRKGRDIVSVGPDEPLERCAAHMKLNHIGALVVCDEDRILKGVIAERDIVHALVDYGPRALQMRAAEVMDAAPATCKLDDTIASIARQMTKRRVRHVPICEDGKVIAVVSIGDIVRERLEEIELERDTLRDMAGAHIASG